ITLDFDVARRPVLPRALHGPGHAERPEVVVLYEDHVRQRTAVVGAAARAHGGLLERAQAGCGLARVPDARSTGSAVDEVSSQRGNTGEVAQEVERGALPREDRAQRPFDTTDRRLRLDHVAVTSIPRDVDRIVELRERLGRARDASDHSRGACDEGCDASRVLGKERSGDVTEHAEVFGQSAGDCVVNDPSRWLDVAHCRAATGVSGRNAGLPTYTPKKKRPRNSSDGSG